ncbi:MAG TPA: hypothetical protein VIN59_08785 [Alphaproteobacteria bacterium]
MKKILLTAAVLLAATLPAKAEVFVWQDPTYDIEVTFPDNWMRQASLDDDLRLQILAPQGMDHAACRLYVTDDGRFKDAPASANMEVSNFIFDGEQIKREIYARPDTDMVKLASYTTNAKLGRAAAVAAEVDFQKYWAGSSYPMHAMVVASQYHGQHIVMSCETLASGWGRWDSVIKGIFKSVDMPSAWAIEPNGMYRRFQDDGGVILMLNRSKNAATIR